MPFGLILSEGKNPYLHLLTGESVQLNWLGLNESRVRIIALPSENAFSEGGWAGKGHANFLS